MAMPFEEHEQRLDLAFKIRRLIRESTFRPKWEFTAVQLAMLMVAPLHCLKELTQDVDDVKGAKSRFLVVALDSALDKINHLLKVFFHGPTKAGGTPSGGLSLQTESGSSRKRPRSDEVPAGAQERRHDTNESKACRERDQDLCIVTGTMEPEACHIVPFSWTQSANNCKTVKGAMDGPSSLLFDTQDISWEHLLGLYSEPGSSDKSWNMVCLNPGLHKWWSKAYFGLEWRGVLPGTSSRGNACVTLRFHWLPTPKGTRPRDILELEKERNFKDSLVNRTQRNAIKRALHCFFPSGRPVLSGHLIQVPVKNEHVESFRAAIQVQWALHRIAAMSGFAEHVESSNDDDDDDQVQAPCVQEMADYEKARIFEWQRAVEPGPPMPRLARRVSDRDVAGLSDLGQPRGPPEQLHHRRQSVPLIPSAPQREHASPGEKQRIRLAMRTLTDSPAQPTSLASMSSLAVGVNPVEQDPFTEPEDAPPRPQH